MPRKTGKASRGHVNKSRTFKSQLKPQQAPDAATAEMMVEGLGMNAVTTVAYAKTRGELDLSECMAALVKTTEHVQAGNLGDLEAMLTAQAVSLNASSRNWSTRRPR